ncbi:unnamed protein product [Diplocarpon coronariae]
MAINGAALRPRDPSNYVAQVTMEALLATSAIATIQLQERWTRGYLVRAQSRNRLYMPGCPGPYSHLPQDPEQERVMEELGTCGLHVDSSPKSPLKDHATAAPARSRLRCRYLELCHPATAPEHPHQSRRTM